jgi:transposase
MGLLVTATVAIDSSKLKAIGMVERRRAHLELGVARYLSQLDTADRQEPSEALATKTTRLKENFANEMRCLDGIEARMLSTPDQQISLTDPDAHSMATGCSLPPLASAHDGGRQRRSRATARVISDILPKSVLNLV